MKKLAILIVILACSIFAEDDSKAPFIELSYPSCDSVISSWSLLWIVPTDSDTYYTVDIYSDKFSYFVFDDMIGIHMLCKENQFDDWLYCRNTRDSDINIGFRLAQITNEESITMFQVERNAGDSIVTTYFVETSKCKK